MITSFCFTNFKVEAKTVTSGRLSASVSGTIYTGSKAAITTKYNKKKITKGIKYKTSNKKIATVNKKGIVKGSKTGSTTITVKYKKKSIKLTSKFTKLSKEDYLDMVNLDYIKIYHNAYYDEYQSVMADSGKGWKNNKEVKKYFIKKSIPKGYCTNGYFNPKAYIKIVKSKYGIYLSSYREALDFYLGCSRDNDDNATYKCIHNGGKFDDTFTDTEYDYYPNVYERYVPMGVTMQCFVVNVANISTVLQSMMTGTYICFISAMY